MYKFKINNSNISRALYFVFQKLVKFWKMEGESKQELQEIWCINFQASTINHWAVTVDVKLENAIALDQKFTFQMLSEVLRSSIFENVTMVSAKCIWSSNMAHLIFINMYFAWPSPSEKDLEVNILNNYIWHTICPIPHDS